MKYGFRSKDPILIENQTQLSFESEYAITRNSNEMSSSDNNMSSRVVPMDTSVSEGDLEPIIYVPPRAKSPTPSTPTNVSPNISPKLPSSSERPQQNDHQNDKIAENARDSQSEQDSQNSQNAKNAQNIQNAVLNGQIQTNNIDSSTTNSTAVTATVDSAAFNVENNKPAVVISIRQDGKKRIQPRHLGR